MLLGTLTALANRSCWASGRDCEPKNGRFQRADMPSSPVIVSLSSHLDDLAERPRLIGGEVTGLRSRLDPELVKNKLGERRQGFG